MEITGPGWLSPDGKFYECYETEPISYTRRHFLGHIQIAEELGQTEWQLEKLGWIKRTEDKFITPSKYPTQPQVDMIFDYCQKEGIPMPDWAKVDNPMRRKNPTVLSPGDQFELLEGLDIYIHDAKQDTAKFHRTDKVITAEPGDIVRFDGEIRPTHQGRKVYQFTLMKDDGTSHRFDMFEPQVQKIVESSVKLGK